MAVSALVLGIVGSVLGLVPLTGFIALICGILGLVFGFVGYGRAREGAPHKTIAIWGIVLGGAAIILGIIGLTIVADVVNNPTASWTRSRRGLGALAIGSGRVRGGIRGDLGVVDSRRVVADIVGTIVVVSPVLTSKERAIEAGVPRLAGDTDDENLKLPAVRTA